MGVTKMKRKLILLMLVFNWHLVVFSNPLPVYICYINEIFFRGSSSWDIEILYGHPTDLGESYTVDFPDTVYITNGQKSAISPLDSEKFVYCDTVISGYNVYLYVLHSEDFGDTIKLISDRGSVEILLKRPFTNTDYMNWGTEKSLIGSPPDEHSISRYYIEPQTEMKYICYDKTPTIGSFNDTLGTLATMTGFIIDKSGDTISSGNYKLDTPIHFREDKSYVTRIFARKAYFSYIVLIDENDGTSYGIPIEPMNIHTYPDSTVKCNIYLKEGNSVEESSLIHRNFQIKSIAYPNPFNSIVNFYISMPQGFKNGGGKLSIYNSLGQLVKTIPISGKHYLTWDGRDEVGKTVNSGVYYYTISYKNKILYKSSIVFLK